MHIVYAKLGQADAGDNEAKLMTKLAPEWVRTSDPVIRSPARYRWTTAPAFVVRCKRVIRGIGRVCCIVRSCIFPECLLLDVRE